MESAGPWNQGERDSVNKEDIARENRVSPDRHAAVSRRRPRASIQGAVAGFLVWEFLNPLPKRLSHDDVAIAITLLDDHASFASPIR